MTETPPRVLAIEASLDAVIDEVRETLRPNTRESFASDLERLRHRLVLSLLADGWEDPS